MNSTALFSGRSAWFSSSCPGAHVDSWVNNGGSRFSSAEMGGNSRGGVDFIFLRDLEDPVYARLGSSLPILISSLWVQVSAEKHERIPLGPFLLDENYSSSSLLLAISSCAEPNPAQQLFQTPLRPTQSYPIQSQGSLLSSVSSGMYSSSTQIKRKLDPSSTFNSTSIEPLRFKKPKLTPLPSEHQRLLLSSHSPPTPPPYLLPTSSSLAHEQTTTPLLLLQHISFILPPASTIPDRGSYRFGVGGMEDHRGGLGIGVFDVEGGREGGRFEAVPKKRVKLELED